MASSTPRACATDTGPRALCPRRSECGVRKTAAFLLALLAAALIGGCATSARMPFGVEPPSQRVSNPDFDASITPVDDHSLSPRAGYKAFLLSIRNKTGEFLEILWDETFFLDPKGENGRFMIDDEANFRNNPLQPNVVFPRDDSVVTLWPANLAHYYGGPFARWAHNNMEAGENGILLTVRIREKIVTEKIVLKISYPEEPPRK